MLSHDIQAELHPTWAPLIIAATFHYVLTLSLPHATIVIVHYALIGCLWHQPHLSRITLSILLAHSSRIIPRCILTDYHLEVGIALLREDGIQRPAYRTLLIICTDYY